MARPSDRPGREVRVTVPAKVNLHLGVGALRPDGFHDLVTVFHAVDLVDTVTVRAAERTALTVTGEGAGALPADAGNLAWRAAELYRAERGGPPVAIDLVKAIPVAGGMAGGSADAAAVLVACAALAGDTGPLDALAAELGSDVVFPLHGGTALGTGRGEHVEALPHPGTLHWAFALADYGIPAGVAYGELDRLRAAGAAPPDAEPPARLLHALAAGDAPAVAAALHNDLEAAALSLHPDLADTLGHGRRAGALAGLVSGSGPTCAFLCPDADAAAAVAAALDTTGLCRATRIARGPAVGARPH